MTACSTPSQLLLHVDEIVIMTSLSSYRFHTEMAGGKLKEAEYHSDLLTDLFTDFHDDVRPRYSERQRKYVL